MYLARMEVRVERIERDIAHIKADIRLMRDGLGFNFRSIWTAMIVSDVVLVALMAIGFGWV
jgi:hypothetical protein